MARNLPTAGSEEAARRHRTRMGSRLRTTTVVWGFTAAVFLVIQQGSLQDILTPYEDIAVRGFQFLLLITAAAYSLFPKKGYVLADIAVRFVGGLLLMGGIAYGSFYETNNLTHYLIWLWPYQLFVIYVSSPATSLRMMYIILPFELLVIICAVLSGTMKIGDPKFAMLLSMITAQLLSTVLLVSFAAFLKKSEAEKAKADALTETANILEEAVREAQEANALALSASHTKSNFLAMMSHELRTPLNAIMGFSEILQNGSPSGRKHDKTEEYAADIHTSAKHLLSVINDVLDLAKIESGKLKRHDETFALRPLLDECLVLVRPLAARRAISILCNCSDDITLFADPRLLKQVMVNLLSNSVKYGRQSGIVRVIVRKYASDDLVIQVVDNGIGMNEATLQTATIPFERGAKDDAQTANAGGTGLGLAIVKSLIELQGGQLLLESQVDVGTTVTVALPASCAINNTEPRQADAVIQWRSA